MKVLDDHQLTLLLEASKGHDLPGMQDNAAAVIDQIFKNHRPKTEALKIS